MHGTKKQKSCDIVINYMFVTLPSSDPLPMLAIDRQGNKAQNGSIKSPCTLSSHQPPKECNLLVMDVDNDSN